MKSTPTVEQVFHALADPTRRAMLEIISEGPVSVSRLVEPLGVSLQAVVQHLQLLEECGLIRTSKEGRVRTCNIERAGFEVAEKWMKARRSIWDKRFDTLGELLNPTR